MQIRRKLLVDFLLSIGLVFTLSNYFFSQSFLLEERLQSVALVSLLLSMLVILLTFFRYAYLIILAQITNTVQSRDMRTLEVRIPITADQVLENLKELYQEWKIVSIDNNGVARLRKPINKESWGEIIEIRFEALDESASWVEISSASIDPTSTKNTAINWQNVKTVERILQRAA